MWRNLNRLHLLALVAILSVASSAVARLDDREQAIDVRADRSEFDEKSGKQTLIGNVEITQGSLRVRADRIDITLTNNELSLIEGQGSPIRFEQENDQGEKVRGEAGKIRYEATTGILVLSGKATLSQPNQELSSERIVFDSISQKVSAEGDGGEGRVSIRIQPPSRDDKP